MNPLVAMFAFLIAAGLTGAAAPRIPIQWLSIAAYAASAICLGVAVYFYFQYALPRWPGRGG